MDAGDPSPHLKLELVWCFVGTLISHIYRALVVAAFILDEFAMPAMYVLATLREEEEGKEMGLRRGGREAPM